MVDVSLLQSLSYVAAAIGVCVAAIYYVMNLREQRRNRRITLTQNIMQTVNSVEAFKIQGELLNMEWSDYDDFERKYGSDYNLDNYAKRMYFFYAYETIGRLLKAGLADSETLYGVLYLSVLTLWNKFLPTITENRRRYTGKEGWIGFEFLAGEMLRMVKTRDPSYTLPETLTKYVPDK